MAALLGKAIAAVATGPAMKEISTMDKSGYFWRGKAIEDLTRDELEAAFVHTANQLKEFQTPAMARIIATGQVASLLRKGQ
jgi:hypothetical protein